MKLWLLLYPDGSFMTWRSKIPRKSDYQKETRLFEAPTATSLGEIADWSSRGYPDVYWLKELKEW